MRRFTIQQRLDNKWRLCDDQVAMGDYSSKFDAEKAIYLILNPVIYFYDENGHEIERKI